jgi:hypothetical protein
MKWPIGILVIPAWGRYLGAFHRLVIIIDVNKRGLADHKWWKFHVLWCEGGAAWVSYRDITPWPVGENERDGNGEVRNWGSSRVT